MADDMLSQDEIDALLKGVSGDEDEGSSAAQRHIHGKNKRKNHRS